MNLKNTNGKNHINQILLELKQHTIQIKTKIMPSIKNIKLGNLNKILSNLTICVSLIICSVVKSDDNFVGQYTDLKILDKISSKNELIKLTNGEEFIYKDLAIKSMKCTNSEFDDNPEIKAYIQVRDLTVNDNDKVYVFNGWMFSSSPSIAPFDHPVYDIWLADCY
jgi:hypothetical protein